MTGLHPAHRRKGPSRVRPVEVDARAWAAGFGRPGSARGLKPRRPRSGGSPRSSWLSLYRLGRASRADRHPPRSRLGTAYVLRPIDERSWRRRGFPCRPRRVPQHRCRSADMILDILLSLATVIVVSLTLFTASVTIGRLLGRLGLDALDEAAVPADGSPAMVREGTTSGSA